MTTETRSLKLLREGNPRDVQVRVKSGAAFVISLQLPDGDDLNGVGCDVFAALVELRRKLETRGSRLACQGSLVNVFPSPMQRQMTDGWSAYALTKPRTAQRPPTVDVLDPAPVDAFLATVEEQEAWFDDWLRQPLATLDVPPDALRPLSPHLADSLIERVREFCHELESPGLSGWSKEIREVIESGETREEVMLGLHRYFRVLARPHGPLLPPLRGRAETLSAGIEELIIG